MPHVSPCSDLSWVFGGDVPAFKPPNLISTAVFDLQPLRNETWGVEASESVDCESHVKGQNLLEHAAEILGFDTTHQVVQFGPVRKGLQHAISIPNSVSFGYAHTHPSAPCVGRAGVFSDVDFEEFQAHSFRILIAVFGNEVDLIIRDPRGPKVDGSSAVRLILEYTQNLGTGKAARAKLTELGSRIAAALGCYFYSASWGQPALLVSSFTP